MIQPSWRSAFALAALVALAGCASRAIDDNVAAARAEVRADAAIDFRWLTSDAARAQARDDVTATLAQPLAGDDAVRIALSASPALQALLFERAAASADATRSGRLPNPVFAFERLAGGHAPASLEVTSALTVPLLDLLLWPARSRDADDRQQQLRLQLAGDVLRAANDARVAWVEAVAAGQSARYAAQVDDAAAAGTALARRMEAAGNISTLQRAREESFADDAAIELAMARRVERQAREALVRTLGLDDAQASALTLPDHLPDLPDLPPAAATQAALQSALDQRLDLRLARARLATLARDQGLTRVTGLFDGLELGVARKGQTGAPDEHGLQLQVPLPLFDGGDAARAGADARYQAALARTAALASTAAAQLRRAAGDVRDSRALATTLRDRVVPLHATLVDEDLRRYDGMLASVFDLLADARDQARAVQKSIAAQRDFWLADTAMRAATVGLPTAAELTPFDENPT